MLPNNVRLLDNEPGRVSLSSLISLETSFPEILRKKTLILRSAAYFLTLRAVAAAKMDYFIKFSEGDRVKMVQCFFFANISPANPESYFN